MNDIPGHWKDHSKVFSFEQSSRVREWRKQTYSWAYKYSITSMDDNFFRSSSLPFEQSSSMFNHYQCQDAFVCFFFIVVLINICMCSIDVRHNSTCPHPDMCQSQWDFCGYGPIYCGEGCKAGPCQFKNSSAIITGNIFQCVFKTLDEKTRVQRLISLRRSGWRPFNKEEAAIFLAHVYHETDGLRTLTEYCAPSLFIRIIRSDRLCSIA